MRYLIWLSWVTVVHGYTMMVMAAHKVGSTSLVNYFGWLAEWCGGALWSINRCSAKVCDPDGLVDDFAESTGCRIYVPYRNVTTMELAWKRSRASIGLLQVRDPRDRLISQWHSFGWSHSELPASMPEWRRAWQESERQLARSLDLEAYVRAKLPEEVERCQLQMALVERGAWLMRMEDMVNNFSEWNRALVSRLELPNEVAEDLERRWMGQSKSKHVRDSSAQQYRHMNQTIREEMWRALEPALRVWYPEHGM